MMRLKRCPFCNGKGEFKRVVDGYGHGEHDVYYGSAVRCVDCGVQTKSHYDGDRSNEIMKAGVAWNSRVEKSTTKSKKKKTG